MATAKACYRKLRHYKYQLVEDYTVEISINPPELIDTPFIKLTTGGTLTVKARYAWDGASGPARDTRTIMRGSLVHDALYQLMREKHIDHKVERKPADEILRAICLEDGMAPARADLIYEGVRIGGRKAAKPRDEVEDEIICVP